MEDTGLNPNTLNLVFAVVGVLLLLGAGYFFYSKKSKNIPPAQSRRGAQSHNRANRKEDENTGAENEISDGSSGALLKYILPPLVTLFLLVGVVTFFRENLQSFIAPVYQEMALRQGPDSAFILIIPLAIWGTSVLALWQWAKRTSRLKSIYVRSLEISFKGGRSGAVSGIRIYYFFPIDFGNDFLTDLLRILVAQIIIGYRGYLGQLRTTVLQAISKKAAFTPLENYQTAILTWVSDCSKALHTKNTGSPSERNKALAQLAMPVQNIGGLGLDGVLRTEKEISIVVERIEIEKVDLAADAAQDLQERVDWEREKQRKLEEYELREQQLLSNIPPITLFAQKIGLPFDPKNPNDTVVGLYDRFYERELARQRVAVEETAARAKASTAGATETIAQAVSEMIGTGDEGSGLISALVSSIFSKKRNSNTPKKGEEE